MKAPLSHRSKRKTLRRLRSVFCLRESDVFTLEPKRLRASASHRDDVPNDAARSDSPGAPVPSDRASPRSGRRPNASSRVPTRNPDAVEVLVQSLPPAAVAEQSPPPRAAAVVAQRTRHDVAAALVVPPHNRQAWLPRRPQPARMQNVMTLKPPGNWIGAADPVSATCKSSWRSCRGACAWTCEEAQVFAGNRTISGPSGHHASTSSVHGAPKHPDTSDNPDAHAPTHLVPTRSDARVAANANTLASTSNRDGPAVHAQNAAAVARH